MQAAGAALLAAVDQLEAHPGEVQAAVREFQTEYTDIYQRYRPAILDAPVFQHPAEAQLTPWDVRGLVASCSLSWHAASQNERGNCQRGEAAEWMRSDR